MDNLKYYRKFIIRGIVSSFVPSIVTTIALEETANLTERPFKYVYNCIYKVKIFKT